MGKGPTRFDFAPTYLHVESGLRNSLDKIICPVYIFICDIFVINFFIFDIKMIYFKSFILNIT